MDEKILSIEECRHTPDEGYNYSGFIVITTSQKIELLISSDTECCENWGYFWCNDTPEDFVGAKLLNVTCTDDALNTHKVLEYVDNINMAYFVNLETDRGTLQFVVYNEHNGYYGHDIRIISKQFSISEDL